MGELKIVVKEEVPSWTFYRLALAEVGEGAEEKTTQEIDVEVDDTSRRAIVDFFGEELDPRVARYLLASFVLVEHPATVSFYDPDNNPF